MEDRQCKQTERYSVMVKGSHYFLSSDDKCKQINNMQGYDPYQIKKEQLSGNIRKFPPVQRHSLITFWFE